MEVMPLVIKILDCDVSSSKNFTIYLIYLQGIHSNVSTSSL